MMDYHSSELEEEYYSLNQKLRNTSKNIKLDYPNLNTTISRDIIILTQRINQQWEQGLDIGL